MPAPDPERFKICKSFDTGRFIVVLVEYPDCTNFEGRKVLVYNAQREAVMTARRLDPHFSESGLSPIARFAPTQEGWDDAWDYANKKEEALGQRNRTLEKLQTMKDMYT